MSRSGSYFSYRASGAFGDDHGMPDDEPIDCGCTTARPCWRHEMPIDRDSTVPAPAAAPPPECEVCGRVHVMAPTECIEALADALTPPPGTPASEEDATAAVLGYVVVERMQQDAKWGQQNHHPDRWFTILAEEVGEAAECSLEDDWTGYRREMVQAAAVIVAAIESLDRALLSAGAEGEP